MKDTNKKILLVEDDLNFGLVLTDYLSLNGYDVCLAKNGMEGYEKFKKDNFDLCIVDVMMPYKDGYTLTKEIREKNKEIPIIFLTAKSMKMDILKGYKVGANDYLNKPIDSEVLLMKINAVINRRSLEFKKEKQAQFEFIIGNFYLNTKLKFLTYKKGNTIKLTSKENELLKMLILNKNELLTKESVLTKIWGIDNYFTSKSLNVYIARLRKYIKIDNQVIIKNIHSKGFKLMVKE